MQTAIKYFWIVFSLLATPAIGMPISTPSLGSQGVFHRILSFDDAPPRQLEADYAKTHGMSEAELKAKVAATGTIKCGQAWGTANITLSSSLITTAEHVICDAGLNPNKCTFTYKYNGDTRMRQVAGLVGYGVSCDSIKRKNSDSYKDWAVLTLTEPANGPDPYRIDPEQVNAIQAPQDIVVAASMSMDFCSHDTHGRCLRDPKTGLNVMPRFVEDCQIKYVDRDNGLPLQFTSNCGGSHGASGGAVLGKNLNAPTLLAIFHGNTETNNVSDQEARSGTPVSRPFSLEEKQRWYATLVPLTGEFAKALQNLALTLAEGYELAFIPLATNTAPSTAVKLDSGWQRFSSSLQRFCADGQTVAQLNNPGRRLSLKDLHEEEKTESGFHYYRYFCTLQDE